MTPAKAGGHAGRAFPDIALRAHPGYGGCAVLAASLPSAAWAAARRAIGTPKGEQET